MSGGIISSAANAAMAAQFHALSQMQTMRANGLDSLRNAYAPPPKVETPPLKMRTREEIVAQLEARYAELEQQAEARQFFCVKCKHFSSSHCHNKLVIGFGGPEYTGREDAYMDRTSLKLCGPEKALWEPIPPTLWQRFIKWISGEPT